MRVTVFTRPVTDQDDDGRVVALGYSEPVVRIEAALGRAWELTMSGDRVTSLTTYSDNVTAEVLQAVPLADLRSVAKAHLARVEAAYGDGLALSDALAEGAAERGQATTSTPTIEEFAEVWRATPEHVTDNETGERLTRRQALARRWADEVSVHSIDKWTKEARQRGLIPPTRGRRRGRKPQGDNER